MTFILFIVIAALLSIIGLIVQGASAFDMECGGFISWLTTRMGPGVTYKSEKVFPGHVVWYALSVVAIVLAIIFRAHK